MKWRIAVWDVVAMVAVLAAMTVLTARSANPALWPPTPGSPSVEIHVVSHGYHSGIVIERAALAAAAERPGLMMMIGLVRATSRAAERKERALPMDSM